MKKIFILGGSQLQLDLILEAKRMFFYTIVLDMDKNCIGSKWCDEFLAIDIADKELVLKKAKEYKIDVVLTSATELGNITACYVGEKMGLHTNSYQTALNTTNKTLMKKNLLKYNITTAKHKVIKDKKELLKWDTFPCIIKPSDSSAGRGLSYITSKKELLSSYKKAQKYTTDTKIIIEEYIEGKQYSIETISTNRKHQIVAINREYIHQVPHIMEISHTIPAKIDKNLKKKIKKITSTILDAFDIKFGAAHIELRVTDNGKIYIVELASRTGGMRSEMINLAYEVSYSQLLLLSSLNIFTKLKLSKKRTVKCNFLISYKAYKKYKKLKNTSKYILFEPFSIPKIKKGFLAEHIGKSQGYYYIIKGKK
jgi:carbamoyl-phosphate synthase large subunit